MHLKKGKADASESLVNVSSSSPLKCVLRFKWLGAFTWLTRNVIFEPQTLLKASRPPVEQGAILFACPLETNISLQCHAEGFSGLSDARRNL